MFQLRGLISRFRAHSIAAEHRLANDIITYELKRIEALQVFEKKLGEIKILVPVYKACCPAIEHLLDVQIINFELKLIAAKSNKQAPHTSAQLPPAQQPHLPHQNSAANSNKRYA